MGARGIQELLLLVLLGAASWTSAQNLNCHKGVSMSVEEDPRGTLNWTTERVETCDNGALCQESALIIKSGARTAVLATKGCASEGTQATTFAQHSPPPGIITVSYSNYCEAPLCNDQKSLIEFWRPGVTPAPNVSTALHCPTCVALGTCLSAPSLPCPKDTNRCYQGRLRIIGGDINSALEVKGCTSVIGCRLMSGVFKIGPMWVKEACPYRSLIQPRKIENGATWLPISVGKFEFQLLLFFQLLVLCS